MLDKIRKLAKERGTSLTQIEKSCGLGERSISKWDVSIPSVEKVKRVADFFGITIDELIKEEVNDGKRIS